MKINRVLQIESLHRQVGLTAGFDPELSQKHSEMWHKLQKALLRIPEVRTDFIARGKQLASDPNYPSRRILRRLAQLFTRSSRRDI
jgi:hypothetical protein